MSYQITIDDSQVTKQFRKFLLCLCVSCEIAGSTLNMVDAHKLREKLGGIDLALYFLNFLALLFLFILHVSIIMLPSHGHLM